MKKFDKHFSNWLQWKRWKRNITPTVHHSLDSYNFQFNH